MEFRRVLFRSEGRQFQNEVLHRFLALETNDLLVIYHCATKLARTIADLAGDETIEPSQMLEALQYRQRENIKPHKKTPSRAFLFDMTREANCPCRRGGQSARGSSVRRDRCLNEKRFLF